MPNIIFIEHDGTVHNVDALEGQSVMRAAIENSVPGILADCGGYANCATCHCYVVEPWLGKLPKVEPGEEAMLSCAIEPRENSRLSCQVVITSDMDGLTVQLPASQI